MGRRTGNPPSLLTSTSRTAGCGPACPVVWEGRAGDCSPYPDRVGKSMLGDVLLDALHQYCRHIDALSRGCGLKSAVKADFNVDIHAFYPWPFLVLDWSHLLSLKVRVYGCEYPPPVPRPVRVGRSPFWHL